MKSKLHYILGCALTVFLPSCEMDNYDPPTSMLQGQIVYNGEPIHVEYSSESTQSVYFQLYEPGWAEYDPINVVIDQDGSYSTLLFDGTYKLIFPDNQGPFHEVLNTEANSDTIIVEVNGNKTMNIEVVPYYMVRNPEFSASNGTVNASVDLEQIVTGEAARDVERVSLYLNKTQFVDSRTSISTMDIAGGDLASLENISLSTDVPELIPSQDYIFVRVGVKISGVEDMIFSDIEKVEL